MASLIINAQPCHALYFYKATGSLVACGKRRSSIVNYKKKIKAMLNDTNCYDNISYANEVERENFYSESMLLRNNSDTGSSYVNNGVEERILQPAPYPIASNLQSYQSFIQAILEMSRLEDLAPSIVIVMGGGWLGGGRSVDALLKPGQVWIVAWCAALITMASMLINDIFDFRSGTDQANGRTSPLLRGRIHPYHVELVTFCLYGASIIGLCYLELRSLRLLIGVVIVATYIYTPVLKKIIMVKNIVVSGIITSSILAGALAIGGEEQLKNPIISAVSLFTFLCFLSREILMDVRDMVGDKATGVNTLAVYFGGQIGTFISIIFLTTANVLLITLLALKAQVFATIGTLILLPLHAKMLSLCKDLGAAKEVFIVDSIQQVVRKSIVHIGFAILVLAFAA